MFYVERFAAYAATFEKAFESGDFSLLEPHFTEDAVYDVGTTLLGPAVEGREAIFAHFDASTRGFDKCFETRTLNRLEGPTEKGDSVWIHGSVIYSAAGVPDLVLDLEETAYFDGDRIERLEDRYTKEMEEKFLQYVDDYGKKLGFSIGG